MLLSLQVESTQIELIHCFYIFETNEWSVVIQHSSTHGTLNDSTFIHTWYVEWFNVFTLIPTSESMVVKRVFHTVSQQLRLLRASAQSYAEVNFYISMKPINRIIIFTSYKHNNRKHLDFSSSNNTTFHTWGTNQYSMGTKGNI